MNYPKNLVFATLIFLVMLAASFGCIAQDNESLKSKHGDLWQITDVNGNANDHVKVDDVFRLKFTPNDRKALMLPLAPMKEHLGVKNLPIIFDRQENGSYYCVKDLPMRRDQSSGEEESHTVSLSVVDTDFIILDFTGCNYNQSHGGTAHVHR